MWPLQQHLEAEGSKLSKLSLNRLSPFSRCEIMLNFWYYLKWSQVTSWAANEHTETLSCSEFLDWLSFIPSLTSTSSLFFIQLLIPSTGLILLPRPFFCPSIPPARLDSAESLPAVTTLTATRGKKDQKHKRVKTEKVREQGNRMSLWFKYISMKLPWNSFYRHTSISDSVSYFHVDGEWKHVFINLLLDYHHFFLILRFIKGNENQLGLHILQTMLIIINIVALCIFIVFHIQIHDSCWTWAKYFSSFLWQGFQQMRYWSDFLKRRLNSHLHTDTHIIPRPRTLQGGSAEPLIIDFPSYFFCLLQWISYPEHIACYGLHKHTYSACKTMHICVCTFA